MNIGPAVEGFLRSLRQRRPVVAMVLDAADVVAVAEHLKNLRLPMHMASIRCKYKWSRAER